jgi:NAD(P)-dependent dehydrogenase (short-subunit alcohol dehydrogenase family)
LVSELVDDANELVWATEDLLTGGAEFTDEQADAVALLSLVAGQDVGPGNVGDPDAAPDLLAAARKRLPSPSGSPTTTAGPSPPQADRPQQADPGTPPQQAGPNDHATPSTPRRAGNHRGIGQHQGDPRAAAQSAVAQQSPRPSPLRYSPAGQQGERMESFEGRLAVVTGGGTGMGRELARQLAAEGCHVAICDVSEESMAETHELSEQGAPAGTRFTTHRADVSDAAQVLAFRDAVVADHATDHINLLFNNAGIGGGGSFVADNPSEWERTFGVCWGGVYNGSRAFLPLLIASTEGHLVNTSSVNGFWASIGPNAPHTAYSAAKFAVKGFTEALLTDLRLHAPHVKASVVMPGHIGTSIVHNSMREHGRNPKEMGEEEIDQIREQMAARGIDLAGASDEDIRQGIQMQADMFRDSAPMSAAEAATVILDGVRAGRWRILVGDDADALDRIVRESPGDAYEPEFVARLQAAGAFGGLDL